MYRTYFGNCRPLLLLAALVIALPLAGLSRAGIVIRVPADAATIQAGIDAAANGDTVLVAPGRYFERLDFNGKEIALKSEQGAQVTTIDGQFGGTVITMQSSEGPNTVVQGFTITRGSASFGAGMYVQGGAPAIRQNDFLDNEQMGGGFGAAIGGFSGSPTVEANTFTGNSCDSQYLSGVLSFVNSSSPRIFNNLIYDNPCRAINMTLPIDAAPLVYNNTIARNRTGIYIDHRVSNSAQSFRNNLIASSDIGLEVAFESTLFDAVWTNNLLFGNTANFSGTPDSTGTHGNVNGDPRLRNAAGGDFHLCPGSAAIDAGIAGSITLPPTDLEGQSRVQDGNGDGLPVVDIGAFEAAPPGPLSLQCAISRKVHGSITFDMQLELVPTNPSTDPRNGPTQTILLTFSKPVAAATVNITEGTATAGVPTFSGNDVVVNLTGVADRQYVTISLTNVAEVGGGAAASGALRIGFLAGDVNQNRVVTLADLARVNAQLSQPVSWSNFLKDVNVSGTLTLSDKGMTNANLTRALPAP